MSQTFEQAGNPGPWGRFPRRRVLQTMGGAVAYDALTRLSAARQARAGESSKADVAKPTPLAAKLPHFPARAKRVIFVFMEGAMSQMDTWEYKPRLQASDGQPGPGGGKLVASKFRFAQHGETGTWVSELFPHMARYVDRFCFLRGLHTDTPAHPQAVIQLHTGTAIASLTRPSLGAWLLYGLGTENDDLPGYITINPPANFGGTINFGSAFLPAHYQGTRIDDTGNMPNLRPVVDRRLQRRQLDLVQELNRGFEAREGAPREVGSVIETNELAYRMQGKVPRLLDISQEPAHVRQAYGVRPGSDGAFARQCLMARRLSEAGVRFVEICQGGWDHHNNLHKGLVRNSGLVDQPVAALLDDLDRRGLLDETLVLFGSEFGRQPSAQGEDGRDHNITGYPMLLAGAGVKAGYSHGGTDEFGIRAISGRMHTTDLHATLLALMGLDHTALTYRYAGRDFRLTDVAGEVAREIFA